MTDELNPTPTTTDAPAAASAETSSESKQLDPELIKRVEALLADADKPDSLVNAFERQKQLNQELKDRQAKLEEILGSGDPDQVRKQLNELKIAQEKAAEADRVKAELEAQYDRRFQESEAAHTKAVRDLQEQLLSRERDASFNEFYQKNGGVGSEQASFRAMADRFIEYDDKGKIAAYKKADGSKFYVEDPDTPGRMLDATAQDFAVAVMAGDYGRAMQQCFKPLNQSSGAGLPGTVVGDDGMVVVQNRQHLQRIINGTDEKARAAIMAGKYRML